MKTIITGIILLVLSTLNAQIKITINDKNSQVPNSQVQAKIELYAQKIDSMVLSEKRLMSSEIQQVNQQWEHKEITTEQADEMKNEISDRYALQIENKVEFFQTELESIINEQVNISLFDLDETNESDTEVENNSETKKYKKVRMLTFTYSLGFSNLTKGWDLESMNDSQLKFGKSVDFTLGPTLFFQPTVKSPFLFTTGLQFRSNNFRAERDLYFIENENGEIAFDNAPYDRLRKAKLRTNSIYIPIGFTYSFRKLEHDEPNDFDFRNIKKGFFIGFQLYGGLNLSSESIVKYYNEDGNKDKDKYSIESVNDLLYGLEFNLGFREYNIYIRKDLSDYFDKTTFTVNNGIEFGIRLGF